MNDFIVCMLIKCVLITKSKEDSSSYKVIWSMPYVAYSLVLNFVYMY